MFDANRVKTWIPKKLNNFIEEISEDSEVVEVVLKDGYFSQDGETVWVFGKDHYERGEYSLNKIKIDLRYWLDQIESV